MAVVEEERSKELVPIFLLKMNLPSKYALQEVYYEKGREIRVFDEKAVKLEALRKEVYEQIGRKFCYIKEYGMWVAVSEEGVRQAKHVSEKIIKKLRELGFDEEFISRYYVRIMKVYLEPEDARELLDTAVRQLHEEVEALKEKIREAEKAKNRSALARLQRELRYRTALMEVFQEFLSQLP